jgi:GNAT superfamily N-acetyltransferase
MNTGSEKALNEHVFDIHPVRHDREEDLWSVLAVYRACEDFLALGPAAASLDLVRADLDLSVREGGQFCGIFVPPGGPMVGVVDYVAGGWGGRQEVAFLSLLMIAAPWQGQGLGRQVVAAIESAVRTRGATLIESAVQVNHPQGIRFWEGRGYRIVSPPEPQPDGTVTYRLRKAL